MDHEVVSFVETNFMELEIVKKIGLDEWIKSENGEKAFKYDTDGATMSDLVIYISPSGKDAAAEIGAAWACGVPILGLYAKGEDFGLMRRMITRWFDNHIHLLEVIHEYKK